MMTLLAIASGHIVPPMTDITFDHLDEIRRRLDRSQPDFVALLGVGGTTASRGAIWQAWRRGDKRPTPAQRRLAVMLDRHGVPPEWDGDAAE